MGPSLWILTAFSNSCEFTVCRLPRLKWALTREKWSTPLHTLFHRVTPRALRASRVMARPTLSALPTRSGIIRRTIARCVLPRTAVEGQPTAVSLRWNSSS